MANSDEILKQLFEEKGFTPNNAQYADRIQDNYLIAAEPDAPKFGPGKKE